MSKLKQVITSFIELITFKQVKKARRRQAMGLAAGLIWSLSVVYALSLPDNESLVCRGPLTGGHKDISCGSCHQSAPGTFRQQMQAKAGFMLGSRESDVEYGLLKVDNTKCLNCHSRPDDHHSVFRFKEPRFAEVRETLDATQCSTCHNEHKGKAVTLADPSFCMSCHEDLKIKEDPLNVSHQQLIDKAMWTTCMQCHDYHGNHEMKLATSLKDTIKVQQIIEYMNDGPDPYSKVKKIKARTDVKE